MGEQTTAPPITSREAMGLALDWAEGRRSYTNLGPFEPYTPDVIAVMDAQEVVKWSAIAAALTKMESALPAAAEETARNELELSPAARTALRQIARNLNCNIAAALEEVIREFDLAAAEGRGQ